MYILGRAKDDPTIKPKQWGPLSSVQAAVRHNCDRLGLPVPVGYLTFWEKAGDILHDLFLYNDTTTYGSLWEKSGVRFHSDDYGVVSGPQYGDLSDLTIAIVVDRVGPQRGDLYSEGNSGNDTPLLRIAVNEDSNGADTVAFDHRATDGTQAKITSSDVNVTDGERHVIITTLRDGDDREIYFDGVSVGSLVKSIDSRSLDRKTIGCLWRTSKALFVTDTIISSIAFFKTGFSDTQAEKYSEQPYALLMPVSRPLIFDLAAGGVIGLSLSNLSSSTTLTNEDISLLRLLKQNNIVVSSEVLNETINQIKLLKQNNLNIDSNITTTDLIKGLLLAINNISSESQVNEIKAQLIKLLNTSDIISDSSISMLDITKLLKLLKLVAADIQSNSAVSNASFSSLLRLLSFNSINVNSEISSSIFVTRSLSLLNIESYADILDVPSIRIRIINPSDISSLSDLSDLSADTRGYLLSDIIASSEISEVKLQRLADFTTSKDRIIVITAESRFDIFAKEDRTIQVH